MDGPPTLDFLRWAVEAASAATDPGIVAGRDRTAAWLDGKLCGTLDSALGVAPGPGERTWTTRVAMARRDELYRSMAAAHFPTDTQRGRARTIHAALSDYAGRGWRHEKGHPCLHPEGSLRFFMWHIMAAHEAALAESAESPARPLSAAHIERLLRKNRSAA